MLTIKNKVIFFLTLTIITLSLNTIFVFANNDIVDELGDDGIHMTGLLEETEEDRAWIEENMTHSVNALLNDIAIDRINDEAADNGYPMIEADGVELGEETMSEDDEYAVAAADSFIPMLTRVDNSTDSRTSKYFPPQASQGSLGSCAAFATTYYQMTYMNALENDYDVKNDRSKILSPKFTYNIRNNGENVGTNSYSMYEVVKKHGCPSIEDFPYIASKSDPLNYREWPTTADIWENALYNRVQDYGYGYIGSSSALTPVESPDDPDLNLIKTYLANGYVLNMSTNKYAWNEVKDQKYGAICISVNSGSGGHSMTIVGYDDTVYYDINEDGVEDPGEFGAFKIINSWGTSGQEIWFMYDALNKESSVKPLSYSGDIEAFKNRQQGWWSNEFRWVTMCKNYTPKLVAEFDVTTNSRNSINMYLGNGTTSDTIPTKTWRPIVLNGVGGKYSIDGTTNTNTATIVLDYSNLIDDNGLDYNDCTQKWFLSTGNSIIETQGFRLKDVPFGLIYSCSTLLNGSNSHIWIDAQLPLKVSNKKILEVVFNWPINPETVNGNTVYVKDLFNNKFPIILNMPDAKTITVTGDKSYVSGNYYILSVDGVKTLGGNSLSSVYNKNFLIE